MSLNYRERVAASKYLRRATYEETERIALIEAASFPPDEKASLEGIRMRHREAGDYFWVLTGDTSASIIGYVNATCTKSSVITHESMESHEPDGETLVIHSVTVEESFRRKGYASFMLKAYLEAIKPFTNIRRILLLCKGYLLSFYKACGFEIIGLSPVVHGTDPWFEMGYDIVGNRRLVQYIVDAFVTHEPFGGNPAAVVMGMRSDKWMQLLAMENNLAETAFLEPLLNDGSLADNIAQYKIRWFTPTVEVELCGHATLAAAHVLFESGQVGQGGCGNSSIDTIRFETKCRGILTATRIVVNGRAMVQLDFPAQAPVPSTLSSLELSAVCDGFHIKPDDILYSGKSVDDLLLRVSPEVFSRIPTLASGHLDIAKVALIQQRGVIVTCAGSLRHSAAPCVEVSSDPQLRTTFTAPVMSPPPTDFLSRFFAPRYGISEDPVTGSAHTALTPYWSEEFQTDRLLGYQQSSRGGLLHVQSMGDRVLLRGESVTMLKSCLLVNE